MHLNPVSLCLLTALSGSLTNIALADTKLTYTDTGLGPQERKTVIQIHGDKVRMGEADSDIYSLYDDTKKILYTVNTKTKQYIETTPDKMRERMTKVAEMQKQFKEEMKKQVAQMPEEQRKPLEERMKQADEAMKAPPPSFKMEKTDRKETIQGMACTISTVKMNDQAVRDVCIAGSDAIPASDQKMLVTMFEYMDSISAESAKAQGVTPPSSGSAAVHKEGLALRIQALPKGPRSELSALGKENLNDADFTLPAGFTLFEPSMEPPAAPPATAPSPAAATPAATAPAPAAK
jgi:Sec-independent protein translocase protein TatA